MAITPWGAAGPLPGVGAAALLLALVGPGRLGSQDHGELSHPPIDVSQTIDSLRFELRVASAARAGVSIPVALVVENTSADSVTLTLRGRDIAFDLIVHDAAGRLIWRRLEDEIIPAILRVEILGPGAALRLTAEWDQRANGGQAVPPGEYRVHGELLTDGAPLRSPAAPLRIEP